MHTLYPVCFQCFLFTSSPEKKTLKHLFHATSYIPESSKGLKFEPLNHQKIDRLGLKFDTLGGFGYIKDA